MLAAIALLATALAIAGKHSLARRELAWLDRQWLAGSEDDLGRLSAEQQLEAYAHVGEGPQVASALAALYQEERLDLLAVVSRLHRAVLVDQGLRDLRTSMAKALDTEASLLASWASSYRRETRSLSMVDTTTQFDGVEIPLDLRVDTGLAAEQARWGVRPSPSPPAPDYASSTEALAHLSPWFSQPTGVELLAPSDADSTLVRLDIDASRAISFDIPVEPLLVPRRGYLAFSANSQIWSVAPDGSGTPSLLGTADFAFPAAGSDTGLWLVGSTPREVDGTGRVIAGPFTPPGVPQAATARGLFIELNSGFELWDPATGRLPCREGAAGAGATAADDIVAFQVLAASDDAVTWLGGDHAVHVTNVDTCRDVFVTQVTFDPADNPMIAVAAFNPGGRTVAISWEITSSSGASYPVELVDDVTGLTQAVPVPPEIAGPGAGPVAGLTWSPDGNRLFWLYDGPSGASGLIDTWQVGDPVAQSIHDVDVHVDGPLVAVAAQ